MVFYDVRELMWTVSGPFLGIDARQASVIGGICLASTIVATTCRAQQHASIHKVEFWALIAVVLTYVSRAVAVPQYTWASMGRLVLEQA